MTKKYKLLKDWPIWSEKSEKYQTIPAGTVFTYNPYGLYEIGMNKEPRITAIYIDKNPDWFEKVEE